MKVNIIIILVLITLFSCEKEKNVDSTNINGYWINLSENSDTLLINDTIILRSHFQSTDKSLGHIYEYNIKKDSIELTYIGLDKITFSKPFVSKFYHDEINKILTIDNFENAYPGYPGDKFKYLKKN